MIPSEVAEIADLIAPGWADMDDEASNKVIAAAYRVYEASRWQPIETAPLGDDDFYLVCCDDPRDDRSPFVVRGSIFKSARTHPVQHHLSMAHLSHWQPLPAKPVRT